MKFALVCLTFALATACQKAEKSPVPGAEAAKTAETAAAAVAGTEGAAPSTACEGKGEACGGSCGMAAAAPAEPMPEVPADATWTEVSVGGMKCGNCARGIERKMKAMPGVLAVSADFATGKVRFATAKPTAAPEIVAEMKANLGFEVIP